MEDPNFDPQGAQTMAGIKVKCCSIDYLGSWEAGKVSNLQPLGGGWTMG